ncbi:hypothetical protein PILCRDRAFT_669375 [Piloderma croceum F 1598]|uniref:Uncharacterized protein n=1 Tax=Piloderma croceum (strain F 1598) TaxID=765440 RepID=A0A0C3BE14_PILCF|nr:hypothetical protein PILCRDRAFT_669375 [Piloderma croceum F 1598]
MYRIGKESSTARTSRSFLLLSRQITTTRDTSDQEDKRLDEHIPMNIQMHVSLSQAIASQSSSSCAFYHAHTQYALSTQSHYIYHFWDVFLLYTTPLTFSFVQAVSVLTIVPFSRI